MTDRQRLDAYFKEHEEELWEDIRTLVRIPSLKGAASPGKPFGEGPAQALEAALRLAAQKGFAVKNFHNYVGTVNFNRQETALGILAHLDVMPQGTGWTYPPFDVTHAEGKLYGRGTADDKGPAMAALHAMCAVKEIRPQLKSNVRLIFGTDEESGSEDIRHYFAIEPPPPHVFSPDGDFPVINVEKGRFSPTFGQQWAALARGPRVVELHGAQRQNVVPQEAAAVLAGLAREEVLPALEQAREETGVAFSLQARGELLELKGVGTGAHGARPESGNNALTALLALLARLPLAEGGSAQAIRGLHALFPHGDTRGQAAGLACRDQVSGALTLNFSVLELTEEGFSASFDCRFPVEADQRAMVRTLSGRLAEFGAQVTQEGLVPPHRVPEDSPFVQTLLGIYRDYTGNPPYCLSIGGGTYVHGIEGGVAYGCAMPGVDNRMHGADEFAVKEHLLLSAKMFAQVILDVCG